MVRTLMSLMLVLSLVPCGFAGTITTGKKNTNISPSTQTRATTPNKNVDAKAIQAKNAEIAKQRQLANKLAGEVQKLQKSKASAKAVAAKRNEKNQAVAAFNKALAEQKALVKGKTGTAKEAVGTDKEVVLKDKLVAVEASTPKGVAEHKAYGASDKLVTNGATPPSEAVKKQAGKSKLAIAASTPKGTAEYKASGTVQKTAVKGKLVAVEASTPKGVAEHKAYGASDKLVTNGATPPSK